MVADLVLIALGIALQPFRLSAFILILSTKDGTKKGLGFILGWLTSLVLVIAVVVLITGGRPVRLRTVPSTVALIIKLALGLALILIAAVQFWQRNRARRTPGWMARLDTMSPWAAAVIAAIMQPWTLVAAAAVTAAEARLAGVGGYLALASFCLLATSSFILLELYAVLAPAASTQLAALRSWLDRHGKEVLIIVCLVVGVWLAGQSIRLLAVTGSASALRPGPPPVPALSWRACNGGFQCATARVPLDYRHRNGMTIRIAVIRHLATGPARPIGSLFVNRGGPAPQVDGLVTHYGLIPAALRARFNIISFDPRGFGHSTAVRCFPTVAAEDSFFAGLPAGFPVGAGQQSAWEQTYARFGTLCAQSNGSLLDHDSTADVARDMDLLRQAVSDPTLNYLGLSYGTGLGATYANLFPARVGRLVLDGNLNPVAWTHLNGGLPTDMRLGSDLATAAVLKAFLDLCGKAPAAACAFSAGTAAGTRAKFSTLLHRLRQHPVAIGNPPQTYTYASTVASVPPDDVAEWPGAASLLQQLWTASAAGRRAPAATQGTGRLANGSLGATASPSAVYTGREQQLAEFCSDSPNPRDPGAYAAAAQLAYARSGVVGPENAWFSDEQCAGWPSAAGQDRYAGPWNRPTANPILLIGNTGDPRTSYQDSVSMSRDLARARLLTVAGYGHTEFDNPSTCAINDEVRYFLAGALPPAGTICPQNEAPFPRPSGH